MIRARQRRATIIKKWVQVIDKRAKSYQEFGDFLSGFVRDLNHRAKEDWAVLVEGKRDERALRELGFEGSLVTVTSFSRKGLRVFDRHGGVIVLTDLDREGGTLASRFVKSLSHDGLETSLSERRRLKSASKGVFLHIENLIRFSEAVQATNSKREFISTRISPEI
jgi:5S rRNA maturation endonuclease (ribonuclease M5)